MGKKLFLFILAGLLITAVVYVLLSTESKGAISVKDFMKYSEQNEEEELQVIGNISEISFDSFSLMDVEFPEYEINFNLEEDDLFFRDFAIGDTVLATIFSPPKKIITIQKIRLEEALKHLQNNKPILEISIIEHPTEIENPCEEIFLKLSLKNVSNQIIYYNDFYDEMFGYYLTYTINGENFNFYNIKDFSSINPGESKEVVAISQEELNSNMLEGTNSISFSWSQKSLYNTTFKAISESEIVEIFLENEDCN